jgi:hypothetical protein
MTRTRTIMALDRITGNEKAMKCDHETMMVKLGKRQ